MSTLAASFLADFDAIDESEQVPQQQQQLKKESPLASASTFSASSTIKKESGSAVVDDGDERKDGDTEMKQDENGAGEDDDEDDEDGDEPTDAETSKFELHTLAEPVAPLFTPSSPLSLITSLLTSSKLTQHLTTITSFQQSTGTVEKDREYPYIIYSNELSHEIDAHITALHKLARDLYAVRYSELEQLLSNPLEYAKIAALIGNETDNQRLTKLLQSANFGLANNVLLTISVTATTTRGKPLSEEELTKLRQVCDTIIQLDAAKTRIHAYISSRMSIVAPNLTAMLGAELSARLVAIAGGVKKLALIPACNLQVLGKKGKTQTGLGRIAQNAHEGLVSLAPVITDTPAALRSRAIRLFANKVALAARADGYAGDDDVDDSVGRGLLQEVTEKIEKWQEAPSVKLTKVLPIPMQKKKQQRGGKRYKKEKERMAQSEVAKQKSRLFMDKTEIVDEYTGEGMGMLGQEGTGVLKIKNKEQKQRLSQKTQQRLKRVGAGAASMLANAQMHGGAIVTNSLNNATAAAAGTASSIAFTPMQGMQLVKTEQTQRVKQNAEYFNTNASFVRVKPQTTGAAASSTSSTNTAVKRQLPPVPIFSATPAGPSSNSSSSSAAIATRSDVEGRAEKKQKV